jgi:Epoxide hydrolase N terminus
VIGTGVPLDYTRELCQYWLQGYDWRACETRLNGFPQFRTGIDGLDIHFLHVRSPRDDALPLVITHGWPGSIVEFGKVIGPLTDPGQGGDWGAQVTTAIGARHPDHVLGIHLNMPMVPADPATLDELTEREQAALATLDYYRKWDSGYSKQQSTRPQTALAPRRPGCTGRASASRFAGR